MGGYPLCQLFDRSRMEAMAAGCAIITTSAGGCPEVVGNAGLVVAPGDVGALKEALSRLIGNPARAEELGRRAALRARERFSWPAVAAHHEAAYEAVLRRQPSPDSVVAPV